MRGGSAGHAGAFDSKCGHECRRERCRRQQEERHCSSNEDCSVEWDNNTSVKTLTGTSVVREVSLWSAIWGYLQARWVCHFLKTLRYLVKSRGERELQRSHHYDGTPHVVAVGEYMPHNLLEQQLLQPGSLTAQPS